MPDREIVLAFALVAATMACTPGPNMLNLLSQTASQGLRAGYVTLLGSVSALVLIAAAAVFGLTSILVAVPSLYLAMKVAGTLYLLYLAVRTFTGALDFTKLRDVAPRSASRLFAGGFLTNALNPKMALLYAALLPPFIHPSQGHIVSQTGALAAVQIIVSLCINIAIIAFAGKLVAALRRQPTVAQALRTFFAAALGFFAIRLAFDRR
jgi:threonine/homoserine/homoserine lactone efflux protein